MWHMRYCREAMSRAAILAWTVGCCGVFDLEENRMGIEIQILDWIQSIRNPVCDVLMPIITALGNAGMIWIILTVVFLICPKTRRMGITLAVALLLDVILCNVLIKNLVARIRPFDINTKIQLLVNKPRDYSFPSGHTAASFSALAALYYAGESRLWKWVLVLAMLIAFSRLYLYVHYPTDVLGGIVLGELCGYLANLLVRRIWNRKRNQRSNSDKKGLK